MKFVTLYTPKNEWAVSLNVTPLSFIEHRSSETIKAIVDDGEYDTGISLGYDSYAIWFPNEVFTEEIDMSAFDKLAEALIRMDLREPMVTVPITIMSKTFKKTFDFDNFIGMKAVKEGEEEFSITFFFVEDKQLKKCITHLTHEAIDFMLKVEEDRVGIEEHLDESNHMVRSLLLLNQVFSETNPKKVMINNLQEIE